MQALIGEMRSIFRDDHVNIEDMEKTLLSYKSDPQDWSQYALFDERKFAFPEQNTAGEPLVKTGESYVAVNEVTYMSDQLGLHRMENPSHSENAVSLHVYSPAYDKCSLFDQRTSQRHTSQVTFWSRYGKLSDSDDVPFDRIQTSSKRG
ncbi:cysteine dioxygenase type I [Teladorsagia circumcincta]|uniref:Cysteine dioxygenase n=1 Tax=Teladorsagia circumcincta TaxID=45464 RepID=A0A2G9TKQ7_TELCI|nr:cysteine dioxygenase type I [Teladorsagia circumcincta]